MVYKADGKRQRKNIMNVCKSSYFYWILNTEDAKFVRQVASVIAVKILLVISAIILNILTIRGLWKLEFIPHSTRLLLLNLSSVNLLIGLLGQPMHVAFLVLLIKGNANCTIGKISDMIFFALWISALLTLLGAASERYISIFYPFFHQRLVLGSKLRLVFVSIWICAITVPSLSQMNQRAAYYMWLSWIIFNVLACVWLTLLYVRIYYFAYKVRRQIRKREQRFRNSESPNRKSTNTTAILCVMTILLYFPFIVILHIHEFSHSIFLNSQVFLWLETLALATSTIDPVVYCFTNKAIRKSVFGMIKNIRHV